MDTNDEIRRARLKALCAQHGGAKGVAEDAKAAGKPLRWETLDQILKKRPLPEKDDGSQSARGLGDPLARKLEEVYDLGRGWFDWPFQAVDFKAWAALDETQRGFVQARLTSAIEEAARSGAFKADSAKEIPPAPPNTSVKPAKQSSAAKRQG